MLISGKNTFTDLHIMIIYAALVLLTVVLFFLGTSVSSFLIILGIIYTIFYLYVIIREIKFTEIKITPIVAYFIFPLFMNGISSIYYGIILSNENYILLGSTVFVEKEYLTTAYLISVISHFFISIFFIMSRPSKIIESEREFKLNYFLILFIVSSILFYFRDYYQSLGIIANIIGVLPLALLSFFAISKQKVFGISEKKRFIILLMCSILLLISNLSLSSKFNLLFSLLPLLWYMLIHVKKIGLVLIAGGTIFFIYLFVFQPLVFINRVVERDFQIEIDSEHFSNLVSNYEFNEIVNEESFLFGLETFMSRMFELNASAYVIKVTEYSGLKYGEDMKIMYSILIPRILWPDKPQINVGGTFAKEYLNSDKVSVGVQTSGELYWNFGFLGVVFGSLLLGALYSMIWKQIGLNPISSLLFITVYIMFIKHLIFSPNFSSYTIGAIQILILSYLFNKAVEIIKHYK